MTLPVPFPDIDITEDYNPAIRLFGSRLISEQTILEHVAEFLAIVFSEKKIAAEKISSALPSLESIENWVDDQPLKYKPPIKLNLKIFALYGVSRIDGKHEVHQQHYRNLINKMGNMVTSNRGSSDQVLAFLEDFLQGFQGAGFNRAWCAQTFYPVSPSLLTQETIWNETKAKSTAPETWERAIQGLAYYFSRTKRNFMARGGEVLYLQLCNVFGMDDSTWLALAGKFGFDNKKIEREGLYDQLSDGFQSLQSTLVKPLDKLVDFLEKLDVETHEIGRASCRERV